MKTRRPTANQSGEAIITSPKMIFYANDLNQISKDDICLVTIMGNWFTIRTFPS